MKASNIKGHCQACGRIQVVLSTDGLMSSHGYTVRSGYFQGVCIGHNHLPLELSRTHLDYVVAYLGREAVMHTMKAERLQSGADLPELVMQRSEPYGSIMYHSRHHENPAMRGTAMMTPWHNASEMEQGYQLKMDISHHQHEASLARSHAAGLLELAARVHGQTLIDRSAEEMAVKQARVAKSAPIAGAFRTKAAQKAELEGLSRTYNELVRQIKDHYLAHDRAHHDAGEALYFALPFELHHWRAKHSAHVAAVYPHFASVAEAIDILVINRNEIKARPVIK